jgi:hypothetical protein
MTEQQEDRQIEAFFLEWEYACCGERFRVGDEVTWRLALMDLDEAGRATWGDHLTELDPELLPALRRTAVERSADSPPEGARLHGMVLVSLHDGAEGGETQRVTARVRAIDVVTQGWREDPPGSRGFTAVPGQLWLNRVHDSETRAVSPKVPRGGRRGVDGWLVTLADVAPAAPAAGRRRRDRRGRRNGRR